MTADVTVRPYPFLQALFLEESRSTQRASTLRITSGLDGRGMILAQ